MAEHVTGEQYYQVDGQLLEIKRQLRQKGGYPFSVEALGQELQDVVEGKFSRPRVGSPEPTLSFPERVEYEDRGDETIRTLFYKLNLGQREEAHRMISDPYFGFSGWGKASRLVFLADFGAPITSAAALKYLHSRSLRSVSCATLLALAIRSDAKLSACTIVALGRGIRTVGGRHFVATLEERKSVKSVPYVRPFARVWDVNCRFAVTPADPSIETWMQGPID